MRLNNTKYLVLVFIALFLASTNEVCSKEAEMNYKLESHSFIESDKYYLAVLSDENEIFLISDSFTVFHNFYNYCSFNILSKSYPNHLRFLPKYFSQKKYLDISVLLI